MVLEWAEQVEAQGSQAAILESLKDAKTFDTLRENFRKITHDIREKSINKRKASQDTQIPTNTVMYSISQDSAQCMAEHTMLMAKIITPSMYAKPQKGKKQHHEQNKKNGNKP